MFFKLTARNPYRDFIRNARRIATATDVDKIAEYRKLHSLLASKLLENEQLLNASPAFGTRCQHWNQRDIVSIKRVTNERNPWLRFKREFELAITAEPEVALRAIEVAISWFDNEQHIDDWICD